MQVVILSGGAGWHTDELSRAFAGRGHAARVVPYDGLVARLGDAHVAAAPFFDVDAVLPRLIPGGSLEQIIYRVNALHWIERRGTSVVNTGRTIERCVDKFYTTALLQDAGLPVPETIVCERADDARAAVRSMRDVVIKPIFGSMGTGIVRVSDDDTAHRVTRALEQINAVFYVQRVVAHGGQDVRAFVAGGRLLAAIERRAPPGDWRTNVARGGTAAAIDVSPEWADLAVRAAAAVDAVYAGVDLVAEPGGRPMVLEVNAIPGWQGLQRATGVDVAAALVGEVEAQVRRSAPSGSRR